MFARTVLTVIAVLLAGPAQASPPDLEVQIPSESADRPADPAADRGVFFGHAETVGAGRLLWDVQGPVATAGIAYGLTEDLQLSLTVVPFPGVLGGAARWIVYRGSVLRLGVQGDGHVSTGYLTPASGGFGGKLLVDLDLGAVALHASGGALTLGDVPAPRASLGLTVEVADGVKGIVEGGYFLIIPTALAGFRFHGDSGFFTVAGGVHGLGFDPAGSVGPLISVGGGGVF